MTSNHHALYVLGYTCYNGRYREKPDREVEQNSKAVPVRIGLQLACMKSELLVIADQNAAGECVPGLVHTPPVTPRKLGAPKLVEK